MKVLITFGSSGYDKGLSRLGESAAPHFDRVRLFRHTDIDGAFWRENERVLSCPRGFGYWLWKPYFLLETLDQLQNGDFVFYCDALMYFVNSPAPLFPLCESNNGVMLFNQRGPGHRNFTYTKMDCFKLMAADADAYFYGDHLNAAFQVYQKNTQTVSFIQEILHWCKNYQAVSDELNTLGENLPGFFAHRHDQSILSILAIKHKIRTFKDISQWGTTVGGDPEYGQIVHHHRSL